MSTNAVPNPGAPNYAPAMSPAKIAPFRSRPFQNSEVVLAVLACITDLANWGVPILLTADLSLTLPIGVFPIAK